MYRLGVPSCSGDIRFSPPTSSPCQHSDPCGKSSSHAAAWQRECEANGIVAAVPIQDPDLLSMLASLEKVCADILATVNLMNMCPRRSRTEPPLAPFPVGANMWLKNLGSMSPWDPVGPCIALFKILGPSIGAPPRSPGRAYLSAREAAVAPRISYDGRSNASSTRRGMGKTSQLGAHGSVGASPDVRR